MCVCEKEGRISELQTGLEDYLLNKSAKQHYMVGLHLTNCLSHTMSNCSSRQRFDNVHEKVSGISGTKRVVD